MSQISRASGTGELIDRVAALLDIPVTDNSIPSATQVTQWLNDGMLLLVKVLPVDRLGWAEKHDIFDNVGAELHIEGNGIIRVNAVRKYGFECTRTTHPKLSSMRSRQPYRASVQSPYYCEFGSQGLKRLRFMPESPGKVHLTFTQMPTAYVTPDWVNDAWVETGTIDAYSPPADLEDALVEYAVIRGKIQDEEPQQVQLLMQQWMQTMGIEMETKATGIDS